MQCPSDQFHDWIEISAHRISWQTMQLINLNWSKYILVKKINSVFSMSSLIQSLAVWGSTSFSLSFAIFEASVLSDGNLSGKNASHGQMTARAKPFTKILYDNDLQKWMISIMQKLVSRKIGQNVVFVF